MVNGNQGSSGESGTDLQEGSSTIVAHIFLLAIPLFSAPAAFYYNSKQASTYSLGLEFLFIGVLVIEFGILVLLKSDIVRSKGMFSGISTEDRFEVRLLCRSCGNEFRHSLTGTLKIVRCSRCDYGSQIRVNNSYDGIVQIDTPSP